MGKGRKSNRTRQMTTVARPKSDIAHEQTATSKRAKSPQNTKEPQCQNIPDQQIPQFLLNLLMLGQFSMVRRGGFAGQGKLGCGKVVTDSCCDTDETEGVTRKSNDDGFNIQCKSCNVVFAVFLGEEEKEIFKRHDKLSPSCSRENAKQNSETSELEKEHTDSNDRPDSGFEEGEDAKKEEEPIVVPKRKTVSISLLEQDVVCDYDSGTEERTDIEAVVTSSEMGMTGKLAACIGKVVTDATDTYKHSPTTFGKDMQEGGAAGGQEPVASPAPSVPTPRVARPWNPKNAKYPQFIEKAERMHSLYSWDKRGYCLGDIADAGLLQLEGTTGELVCFFCAVTVACLQKHDDAWIEHAIRSPDCDYIRHKKGQDYLNVIIDIYLDGDMDAVNKAVNAVAAIRAPVIPNGTFRNSSETLTSGATGISLGATGSTYGATGSDYSTTTSGPVTMNKVSSDLPPNYRGGLRGGAPDSVNSQQTYRPSSQNISSDSLFSSQKSSNNPQTVKITSSNTSTFTVPKPIDSKPKGVRPPRIPKRQVQAREVRARLDTDGAQRIISMGYEAQLVGAVIAEQLIYNGDDFKSFTAMMMAVIDAKEMGDAFPANHYDLGLNSNTSKSAPPMSKGEPVPRPPSPAKSSPAPERVPSPKALVDELRSLEIENEKLKETQTCTVCMDLERDVLFVPCGHLVVCQNCSPRLKCCPLCRRGIKGIVKVFLS